MACQSQKAELITVSSSLKHFDDGPVTPSLLKGMHSGLMLVSYLTIN
jgi:hypothetical protein